MKVDITRYYFLFSCFPKRKETKEKGTANDASAALAGRTPAVGWGQRTSHNDARTMSESSASSYNIYVVVVSLDIIEVAGQQIRGISWVLQISDFQISDLELRSEVVCCRNQKLTSLAQRSFAPCWPYARAVLRINVAWFKIVDQRFSIFEEKGNDRTPGWRFHRRLALADKLLGAARLHGRLCIKDAWDEISGFIFQISTQLLLSFEVTPQTLGACDFFLSERLRIFTIGQQGDHPTVSFIIPNDKILVGTFQ